MYTQDLVSAVKKARTATLAGLGHWCRPQRCQARKVPRGRSFEACVTGELGERAQAQSEALHFLAIPQTRHYVEERAVLLSRPFLSCSIYLLDCLTESLCNRHRARLHSHTFVSFDVILPASPPLTPSPGPCLQRPYNYRETRKHGHCCPRNAPIPSLVHCIEARIDSRLTSTQLTTTASTLREPHLPSSRWPGTEPDVSEKNLQTFRPTPFPTLMSSRWETASPN